MSGPRCRRLRSARGADRAGGRGAGGHLVVAGLNVKIARFVAEYLLPLLTCPCCGNVNAARGRAVVPRASLSYGPGIKHRGGAAVFLTATCRLERPANLIGMPVSAGFVDLAIERLSARLQDASSMTRCRQPWRKSRCWPPMRLRSICSIRTPGWQRGQWTRRTCWWSALRIVG